MLRKLLKYDLKSVIPFLCVFYVLAIGFAGLSRLFLCFSHVLIWEIMGQIFSGAAISMMFSIFINTAMRAWVLFRQNLYGDPSYLTHTLPVHKRTIYLSKALTALIALMLCFGVIGLTLIIQYAGTAFETVVGSFLLLFSANHPVLCALLLLSVLFLQVVNILQCGFSGIILGHKMNKAKIGWSVLAGFGLYAVGQLLLLAAVGIMALFNQDFMQLFTTAQIVNIQDIWPLMIACCILDAGLVAGGCCLNIKWLKQGVNVD